MTVRNIKKSLAGTEDLALGIGTLVQERGTVHRVNVFPSSYSYIDMQQYADGDFFRLYGSDTFYTDYRRNPAGTVGIPAGAGGVWEPLLSSDKSVGGNFTDGAYLVDAESVAWHAGTTSYYSWTGTLPHEVAPGTDPTAVTGYVPRADVVLRDQLSASVVSKASTITPDIFDFISGVSGRHVIYAEEYGVVNSSSIDSSDALQKLADENQFATIILPTGFALAKSIKYKSYCDIRGTNPESCVCFLLPGFTSDHSAVFEPADPRPKAVLQPKISNMSIVDTSAVADGRGTSSLINGVELLGTFRGYVGFIKGNKINNVVHCEPGDGSVFQYTMRPKLEALDGSNVNKLFCFEKTDNGRFGYGDIQCCNIYSTGSIRYGASAEDTDGFTWVGSTMFPDAQLKVSGNYISIAVCHPFEAKAKLTDPADVTAECLVVAPRNGGARSNYVNISAISAAAGRLADTTIGSPPQTNKGGNGISIYNADGVILDAVINDPSQHGLLLSGCYGVEFDVVVRRANTQLLGSGALPASTYDGVNIVGCGDVIGNVINRSPDCRYAAYVDDTSTGVHLEVVASYGGANSSNVRLPVNGNCSANILSGTATGYKRYTSAEPKPATVIAPTGQATPSDTAIRHGVVLRFDNSTSVNVTDLPTLTDYDVITIHLQDNGGTKLVPVAAGGKFVWIDGSTTSKLGRGTIVRVMRAPTTGYLVQI